MRVLLGVKSRVYTQIYLNAVKSVFPAAKVETTATTQAMLQSVEEDAYDLIIADFDLHTNGDVPAVAAQLRKNAPRSVIIASGVKPFDKKRPFFTGADAIALGATGFIEKPLNESFETNVTVIAERIKTIFYEKPASHPQSASKATATVSNVNNRRAPERRCPFTRLILIAASTGGPYALDTVLSALPENLPAPIVVIQHMPPNFIENLSRNIDRKAKITVKTITDEEELQPGTAYLAPGGFHAVFTQDRRLSLKRGDPVNGVCPSADVCFVSAAQTMRDIAVMCVVMTGMGKDGTAGVAALKGSQETVCVAQSESTCVVYGMPRAVNEAGLCDETLDLTEIAPRIEQFAKGEKPRPKLQAYSKGR